MVEKPGEASGRGKRFDWIAIHDGWRRGETAEALADRFGLRPKTIQQRCGWIDGHFPPSAPRRLIAQLSRRLTEAHAALEAGALVDAERRAKALTAMIRAARALEDWSMELNDAAETSESEAPASDRKGYKAELERRLDRLAETLAETRASGRCERRGREDASGALDGVGETGADPT